MTIRIVFALAGSLLVGGCLKDQGKIPGEAEAHFYRSSAECEAAGFYSSGTCRSGQFVVEAPKPLPVVRRYDSKAACASDDFYSQKTCGTAEEPTAPHTEPMPWESRPYGAPL
jgi:hypothetical protein